jgi:hypothetical protein
MTSNVDRRHRSVGWQCAGGLGVAVLSAALWFGWLGWDTEYHVDPVSQVESGPYEAWQVIGCGVTLVLLLVGALLMGVRAPVASAAMTLAFTAAWTTTAATNDETGMFGVGAVLVFVGLAVATAVVSVIVVALRRA